jgi:hypothetical protein
VSVVLSIDVEVASADRASLLGALNESRRVRARLDRFDIAVAARLAELSSETQVMFPERDVADATRVSLTEASRHFERAKTIEAVPELGQVLDAGQASAGHVDVVTRAMHDLNAVDRQRLAERGDALATAAARQSRDEFAKTVRRHVRQLASGDGVERLERQRRAVRMRTWIDRDTGMWCVRGEFDPERGLILESQLQAKVDQLFHDKTPPECPTDPMSKQQYLRALAFAELLKGSGGKVSTEVMVVIDAPTLIDGAHPDTMMDLGLELDLPVETVRRMACCADVIVPVITAHDGVALYLGRERREPSKAQRRALRAMYHCCAIPGCTVAFDKCQIHHVHWWRRGGLTDIDNLLPICFQHHHCVHEGRWNLRLGTDRSVTVIYPDGSRMTTGPPKRRAG